MPPPDWRAQTFVGIFYYYKIYRADFVSANRSKIKNRNVLIFSDSSVRARPPPPVYYVDYRQSADYLSTEIRNGYIVQMEKRELPTTAFRGKRKSASLSRRQTSESQRRTYTGAWKPYTVQISPGAFQYSRKRSPYRTRVN